MSNEELRAALAASVAIYAVATATPAMAQDKAFNVPAQSATTGIPELARQADVQILVSESAVRGKAIRAVRGTMSVDRAIRRALAGTGLHASSGDGRTFTLAAARNDPNSRPTVGAASSNEGGSPGTGDRLSETEEAGNSSAVEIVVTGSHIRGQNPTINTRSLDRTYIQNSGYAAVAELMSSLPENSGAGFTATTANLSPASGAFGNQGATTGVDLRGQGSGSTLVLINGNRAASNGQAGVVDVSAIPLSALKRVDLLPDGASAIYGSDAVGGVVNFVLDDDVQGGVTTAQYGIADGSKPKELRLGQTVGGSLGPASGTVTYEYYKQTALFTQDRSFSEAAPADTSLIPSTERHSVVAAARADLSGSLSLDANALFSSTRHAYTNALFESVTNDRINSLSASSGLTWTVGSHWTVRATATYGNTADRQSTAYTDSTSVYRYHNKIGNGQLTVDGVVADLPSGPLKLAAGVEGRKENFKQTSEFSAPTTANRRVGAVYLELLVPAIGKRTGPIGLLTADLAVRSEHYSDFGWTTNPKFGLSWEIGNLTFRGSWGTSFKAPTLYNLHSATFLELVDLPDPTTGAVARSALVIGGNPNLQPQTARTTSAGLTFRSPTQSALTFGLNYFRIKYRRRIEAPETGGIFDILPDENQLGPALIRNPSAALIQDYAERAGAGNVLNFLGPEFEGEPYTAADFQVLSLGYQNQNLASSFTDGLDFRASYEINTRRSVIALGGVATYLFHNYEQVAAGFPIIQQRNTIFYTPAFKARLSGSWLTGRFAAATFVNFEGSYSDNSVAPSAHIRSLATVDLTLRYDASSLIPGLGVSINARNLLNSSPPFIGSENFQFAGRYGFDPANGDPIKRFISVTLSKRW